MSGEDAEVLEWLLWLAYEAPRDRLRVRDALRALPDAALAALASYELGGEGGLRACRAVLDAAVPS